MELNRAQIRNTCSQLIDPSLFYWSSLGMIRPFRSHREGRSCQLRVPHFHPRPARRHPTKARPCYAPMSNPAAPSRIIHNGKRTSRRGISISKTSVYSLGIPLEGWSSSGKIVDRGHYHLTHGSILRLPVSVIPGLGAESSAAQAFYLILHLLMALVTRS